MKVEHLPGIAEIHTLRGSSASEDAVPELLIEVPHGADTQGHYDALGDQLTSPLPANLERFFHVNTDVGAWPIALSTAHQYVAARPEATVQAIRCAIPRTFIDVNRVVGMQPHDGLTPGLQPWITTREDRQRLNALHARYTHRVRREYHRICSAGGRALIPHTYAPRSVPITRIDDQIVIALEAAYQPEILDKAPLRAEVDLITDTPDGVDRSPPGLKDALNSRLSAIGIQSHHNGAYNLHPATMGAKWSDAWPGQVLCFEVRRDLVTEWVPFVEKVLRIDRIDAIAGCLVGSLNATGRPDRADTGAAPTPG